MSRRKYLRNSWAPAVKAGESCYCPAQVRTGALYLGAVFGAVAGLHGGIVVRPDVTEMELLVRPQDLRGVVVPGDEMIVKVCR